MRRIGKTTTIVGTAFLLTVALALAATARPSSGSGGTGRMLDRLDLSDETRASLEAVVERSREEARPLRNALEQEREVLESLLSENPIDTAAALEQVERLGEARTALEKHRVRSGIEMQELMTDEERGAWNDAIEARKQRRQRMFERFRGRGDLFGFEGGAASGSNATPLP